MNNHRLSIYGLVLPSMLVLLLAISSCAAGKHSAADITPAKAEEMIKANATDSSFVILDVRTPEEFDSGHLAGAVNVDFRSSNFAAKLDSLPNSGTYLVYCRTGHRSANALNLMKEKRFEKAFNMLGGITRWREEGRPIGVN